jgi:hypothetical protein
VATRTIVVPSVAALHHQIRVHLVQGFFIQTANPYDAFLFKTKQFDILWAVIGFFVCLLPLLVYLLVYLVQQDVSVHIVVELPPPPMVSMLPPPSQPYWDGTCWIAPGG